MPIRAPLAAVGRIGGYFAIRKVVAACRPQPLFNLFCLSFTRLVRPSSLHHGPTTITGQRPSLPHAMGRPIYDGI